MPSKSKPKKSAFADANGPSSPSPKPYKRDPARQRFLIFVFLTVAIGGGILAMVFKNARLFDFAMGKVEQLVCHVKKEYEHDKYAFTQGLFFDGDMMYESTGLNGESTMRLVDYKTGEVKKRIVLDKKFFGEGCTMLNGKIYQLTWKQGKCFVYNKDLVKEAEFDYETEGWGLTNDGTNLIMTDGTAKLIYVDPSDFSIIKKVFVKFGKERTSSVSQIRLNELEYYEGFVFANHYDVSNGFRSDYIYAINAESGKITSRIDLEGLWPLEERPTKPRQGVMNGIAVSPEGQFFVTGKYCPKMFEVDFVTEKVKEQIEKNKTRAGAEE